MDKQPAISADEALRRLLEGNERFLRGEAHAQTPSHEALEDLSRGQHPFATILGCSDSRVPPEWIFDAEPGDLFVVRVAGNVLSPEVAGSLQYAGRHLQTPLLVVLGHEGCGAIQAAMETKERGTRQPSRIQLLVDSILPALDGLDPALSPEARLAQAVENNVRWTQRGILDSPEVRMHHADSRVKFVGAIYEIRTGRVRLLDH
jgi:carbonic anhydrase